MIIVFKLGDSKIIINNGNEKIAENYKFGKIIQKMISLNILINGNCQILMCMENWL